VAIRTNGTVLRQLQTLFDLGSIGDLTDGQLLERFTTNGDESSELAFAALVERHGPMVLRVCRNALVDPNDAQDAFQVTFLVLVRKARSLWVRDSLGPWLHRVACRVASRARASAARRRAYERRAAESRPALMFPPDDWKDVCSILHEEIDRLPERCRVPVVLCDLEGLTHEQAARRLSWPIGTVKSRLTLGRDRLRGRLIRRGMAPTAGLLPISSTAQSAPAALPAGLIEATVKAARSVAAGLTTAGAVPATVHLLLKGVLTAMFMTKIRLALLACGLLATGVAVLAQQSGQGPEAEIRLVQAAATKSPETPSDDPDAIDALVSRDMERLDVELLSGEMQQLKSDVQNAYGRKTQAERPDYPKNADGSPRDTPKQARSDYEALRKFYQAKLRELMIATQRLETEQSRARAGDQKTAEPKPPSKKPSGEKESARSAPNPPAAVIGSIDLEAVFKRWVKAQEATKSHQAAVNVRRGELMKIESEAREEMEMLKKLQPGTADYKKHEDRIAELKAMMEAGREQAQRDFTIRESQIMASLLQEIQEMIATVAKAKRLNYIVKVAPEPKIDANPNDVMTALGRSILYADPRNDITEEVIGDLNQRFQASEHKSSK
jgi:RNA polymerase sigma factor (sigma-70 family)